jgi:hypothetical protein
MRTSDTILGLLRERGSKGLPLERVYRLLYTPDLYLTAYGKIYRNHGAMTKGTTDETVDGMRLSQNCNAHPSLTRWDVSMATRAAGLHPQETGEDAPTRPARLVIETRAGSHPHAPGGVLRTAVESPRTRISTWTGMPQRTARNTDPVDRHRLVLGGRYITLF